MLILSVSKVRACWSEILRRVAEDNEKVIVVKHGKPIAVITQYREEPPNEY